ncbi:hypothetical protein NGRA_2302 [Nosema granulosis]|uniref:Integrase catalytic domain-containing protein n=1 Tax=Nosema granulosis TaxID=83296 RepID=A0A9P6GXW9_9MICR|nr:hypothetical protein NGRA_2302 [Nosema granulosis]
MKPGYFKRDKNIKITANKQFERICTDIYGSFPISDYKTNCLRETGYILTVTDIFTRFTKLFFSERIDARFIKKSLETWFTKHGKPKVLISDNGRQYINQILKNYLHEKDISHILIPEYTSSSNGISERLNKTLSFILTANKGKSIHDIIRRGENNLNYNHNRSIGTSPIALATGKDPFDIFRLSLNRPRRKTKHHSTRKRTTWKLGDSVYIRNFKSHKLGSKYDSTPRWIVEVGKKGLWVKLEDNPGWTHSKNIKLAREGSMWY